MQIVVFFLRAVPVFLAMIVAFLKNSSAAELSK